jgi:CheY-like chemotaxis protein
MRGKILIIDDDKVTLTMLEMILSRHGYLTLSAQDGAEGLETAIKHKPDVVISDMLIPKVHGLELCAKIRQDPQLKETGIILMTAVYKGAAFQFEAKDSGADHFIEKPIDTNGLLQKLEELIAK